MGSEMCIRDSSNLGGIESIGPPGGTLTDAHENNINKYINLFK